MNKEREIAARIWCDDEMKHLPMDADAAEEIAKILKRVRDKVVQPDKLTVGVKTLKS